VPFRAPKAKAPRSKSEGSTRLILGLALAIATVAFLALSIGVRDILNAAG